MLGAASLLTAVTLLGLVAGFAREWLLVANWGASARTDAWVVALFLPEAVRAVLAAGVLTSAALPLWHAHQQPERARWFSQISLGLGLVSVVLAGLVCASAVVWIPVIGPGLAPEPSHVATQSLRVLAWSLPGIVLQAWWSVSRQAEGRFLWVGLGSLVYNVLPMAYLFVAGPQAQEGPLSLAFVAGSVGMALLMWPSARSHGLAWFGWRGATVACLTLWASLGPLMASALTGQLMTLIERMVASYLGEGVVTALNLARKLLNLPLMALQSLNQVLLSHMSRRQSERVSLLQQGLRAVTMLSLPASLGLVLGAPAVVALLFPKLQGSFIVVPLLAGYAMALVPAGWNTVLARYHYAEGDTRTPWRAELAGSVVQAVCLPLMAHWMGAQGIVWALCAGTMLTGTWLLRPREGQAQSPVVADLLPQAIWCGLTLSWAWWGLREALRPLNAPGQLAAATVAGGVCLLLLAWRLKPWQAVRTA